jgi:hypothetical protein
LVLVLGLGLNIPKFTGLYRLLAPVPRKVCPPQAGLVGILVTNQLSRRAVKVK